MNKQPLIDFMQTHLPIHSDLGIQVDNYDGKELRLRAPLDPNINDKGTAFGGSIYCVAVMSCWGTLYLKAIEHGLTEPNMVVSHGEIDYMKPVPGDIVAVCEQPDQDTLDAFWQKYDERGKAKINLSSKVVCPDGKVLAEFKGEYAIIS